LSQNLACPAPTIGRTCPLANWRRLDARTGRAFVLSLRAGAGCGPSAACLAGPMCQGLCTRIRADHNLEVS
jgi:hypothetical protein